MKKIVSWMSILLLFPLVACSYSAGGQPRNILATPSLSAEMMQTQISQLLTVMPTTTGESDVVGTPTLALPTVAVDTSEPSVVTATSAPEEATSVPEEATNVPTETQAAPTDETQATATPAPAAATATPTQPSGPTTTPVPGDPRTRLGSPTSRDPMDDESAWIWPTGADKYSSASFSGGFQTITALTSTDGWRLANPLGREFSNLYLESTFRTGACSGSDHYGLMVRVPVVTEADQGYLFGFTCDGRYSLRRWNSQVGAKGEMKWLVNWTKSSAITAGKDQTNRMGIMMVGSRLLLYANGRLLTEVKDATFPSGYFGVFIGSDETTNLKVQIDEMSYWENPQP